MKGGKKGRHLSRGKGKDHSEKSFCQCWANRPSKEGGESARPAKEGKGSFRQRGGGKKGKSANDSYHHQGDGEKGKKIRPVGGGEKREKKKEVFRGRF